MGPRKTPVDRNEISGFGASEQSGIIDGDMESKLTESGLPSANLYASLDPQRMT